jgi:hypothetical protein
MSKKKEAGLEKPEWKFFWKNVDGLGRINRMGTGAALIFAGSQMKDSQKAALLVLPGVYLLTVGFLRWCSLRALFRKPTKRAFRRHYPEAA